MTARRATRWTDVCRLDDIVPDTGVCALVGRAAVAVFRVGDRVYALSDRDPFSGASVLSRGIVGDRGGVPKVASPMYKQSFALATGECLDDSSVRVETYDARVRNGVVQVRRAC
jgi:nitrite reductase (NADH) small subunit